MFGVDIIITLCWLTFLTYWGINWWRVKPAQETAWKASNGRWTIIWICVLIFLVIKYLFQIKATFLFTPVTIHNPILLTIGDSMVVIGLIIAIVARKTLADNWSSNIELKKDHTLITTGIYRYIRHPIYTGIGLMGLGTIIAALTIYVTLFFIVMIGFFIFKLKKEEKLLLKHFPKEYPLYMKKTKALIPFVY